MRNILLILIAAASLTLALAKDKEKGKDKVNPAKSAESDATTETAVVTPAASRSSTNNIIDPDTRDLKPHDVFRYAIEEDPQRSIDASQVSITDVYDAHFPVSRGFDRIVTINVRNKKLPDIRNELKSRLEADFYNSATISLDLIAVNRSSGEISGSIPKAIFFGEMRGQVPLPEGERKTLSEAVLLLGYNDFADLKRIKINRRDPVTGKPTTIKVNVDEIIKDNKIDRDVELLDGDRVEVPSRKVLF